MPKERDSFKYKLWRVVVSTPFEYFIMTLIVLNTVLLMMKVHTHFFCWWSYSIILFVSLSVCNAMGEKWFYQLLFKIDGLFFVNIHICFFCASLLMDAVILVLTKKWNYYLSQLFLQRLFVICACLFLSHDLFSCITIFLSLQGFFQFPPIFSWLGIEYQPFSFR